MAKDYRDLRGKDKNLKDGNRKPKMEPYDRKTLMKTRLEDLEDLIEEEFDPDLDMCPSDYGWDDLTMEDDCDE
jgi:hypothetical protein